MAVNKRATEPRCFDRFGAGPPAISGHAFFISKKRLHHVTETYVQRVEAADGQSLESAVRQAFDEAIVGLIDLRQLGAIRSCCILAGARTLRGACTPLMGTSPTVHGFVEADYHRSLGLTGNGINKYLDTLRPGNADPQDDSHLALFINDLANTNTQVFAGNVAMDGDSGRALALVGGASRGTVNASGVGSAFTHSAVAANKFGSLGVSRNNPHSFTMLSRGDSLQATGSARLSTLPIEDSITIFRQAGTANYSPATIAYYSLGRSVDLVALHSVFNTLLLNLEQLFG